MNIAIDEALFVLGRQKPTPIMRVWEQNSTAIVLGRSQKPELEINTENCLKQHIPISRRCSAGGTVIQKEGSLNFVFHFPVSWNSSLIDVRKSFQFFAEYIQQVLALHQIPSGYRLLSDITNGADKKLSGNAQSRSQHSILHHGTLLAKPCHELMHNLLLQPLIQPEYRLGRNHQDFVTSLEEMGYSFTLEDLSTGLNKIIPQSEILNEMPQVILEKATELLETKYKFDDWNLQGKIP
jgi:lipoate-protein ligase A